jgi:alkanesulfonate monooxygenase SsuD/methylene tetrahydromethanopterin reductase-like flavin-dependent oxidoreductase (luciferase family)
VAPRRPLKVGVIGPTFEGEWGGATARWSDFVDFARLAEDIGFDSLWVADHLLFRADDGSTSGTWECCSLLTALAAVTHRVQLGSLVLCTGFRNPALLAKMADTIEEISGGRLILGLGAGWNEPEYRAFGYPFDHRVDRFEEALQIICPLLREGYVDFSGTYYEARDCELRPRGPRPTGPTIMIGTARPRMLRLTARYADLWNVMITAEHGTRNRLDRVPLVRAAVDAACLAEGRDPATLARSTGVLIHTIPEAPMSTDAFTPLRGTPEKVAEVLRAYATEGFDHVQLWIEPLTLAGIAAFAPVLELLDRG